MLEVCLVLTKTELKCGNLKILVTMLFADRARLDWRIIPHTTVSKHTQIN